MFEDVSKDYFEDPIPNALNVYNTSDQKFEDQVKLALRVQSTVSQRLRLHPSNHGPIYYSLQSK